MPETIRARGGGHSAHPRRCGFGAAVIAMFGCDVPLAHADIPGLDRINATFGMFTELDRGDMFTHLLRFGGEPAWRAMAAKDLAGSAEKAVTFGTFHGTLAKIGACVAQIERECALIKGPVPATAAAESKTEAKKPKASPFTVYDVLSDAPSGVEAKDKPPHTPEADRWMTHAGTPLDAATLLSNVVKAA